MTFLELVSSLSGSLALAFAVGLGIGTVLKALRQSADYMKS